jgi:hypothetical protein
VLLRCQETLLCAVRAALQSAANTAGLRLFGWLLGQSVANHAPLGLTLPPLMMAQLLATPAQPCTPRYLRALELLAGPTVTLAGTAVTLAGTRTLKNGLKLCNRALIKGDKATGHQSVIGWAQCSGDADPVQGGGRCHLLLLP